MQSLSNFRTPGMVEEFFDEFGRVVQTFVNFVPSFEGVSCTSSFHVQEMSVQSNIQEAQLRPSSSEQKEGEETYHDGYVERKPGDSSQQLVWDALLGQFLCRKVLPEGFDVGDADYELFDGDPLRASQQRLGIEQINNLLMAPDAVDVFSGRTIAAHWAKNQWLVPSDITGDFRPALYKELGIVVPSSLEGCDPEVDYMDVEEVEVFPSAFLNADPHDEDAVVAPIRFGDRGGDMQYLTEVFVTAINDGTFDEVALYARKDLGYPDYMIQRARALAGRSPGARPIKYGRDKAHRSRYFGESTMAGRKRQAGRLGYFVQQKKGAGTTAPVHLPLKIRPGPIVQRPTLLNFTPEKGKAWLAGEKKRLLEKSSPSDLIAMNDSAAALSRGSFAGSRGALESALANARVYRWDRKPDRNDYRPRSGVVDVRFDVQRVGLSVGGLWVGSLAELQKIEGMFRRNKPFYRMAVRYFMGELNESEIRMLRSKLDGVTLARHQGGKHSVEVATDLPSAVESLSNANVNVNVHHDFSFLPELAALAREAGVPNPKIRLAVQIVTLLLGVFTAPTPGAAALQAIQFVAGVDVLWRRFGKMLSDIARPGLHLQSLSEFGGAIWEAIMTSSAAMMVRSFFSDAWELFIPSFEEMASGLKKGLIIENGKAIAQAIMRYFSELIERLKRCIKERSLSPLWGETWDPMAWEIETRAFIQYYALLTTAEGNPTEIKERFKQAHSNGLPVWWNSPMHTKQYVEALGTLVARGREISGSLAKHKSSNALVKACLENAIRFREQLLNEVHGSGLRIAPLGIFLFGEAGTWKTNMADTIARVIAEDNDFDTTSAGTYEWRKGVNFQDGLTHRQWHLKMDDIDQSVAPPTAGVQTHVEVVIDVVNNTPLPVESAAVEMKGKIRAAPLLVTYCSNYPHAQLRGRTLDPLPFFRRLPIRARVVVKPQYSTPAGGMDKEKAKAAKTHDLWDLHVQRFDTTHYQKDNPFQAAPYGEVEVMSFPAFCIFMKKEFRKHLSEQREYMNRSMRGEVERCVNCGLPTDWTCGCRGSDVAPPSSLEVIPDDFDKEEESVTLQGLPMSEAFFPFDDEDEDPLSGMIFPSDELPWWRRPFSAMLGRCRRFRFKADELLEQLREAAHEELSLLALQVLSGATLVIAVGALVVRLVNNYGTTLQSRSDAVSWLGVPATWQRPAVDFSPSQPPLVLTPTFVHDDLVKSIRNSYVIISRGEEGCLGLLISNGMVMYPEHVVPIGSKGKLKYGSVEVDLCPTEVNAASVNDRQALVVRVSGLPAVKGAGHCFPMVDDVTTTTFDEVELVYPDKLAKPDRNWVMATSKGRSLATSHVTVGGDCGVVYLGRIGTTWYARAMHYGLTELLNVNYSMGEMLTQTGLRTATSRAGVIFQSAQHIGSLFSKDEVPFFAPLPDKSEARLAKTKGAKIHILGELHPRPFGSTPRTNVRSTIIAEYFRDLEKDWCGAEGYWTSPVFRGKMLNDQWWSPWQDNLLAFKISRSVSLDCLLVSVCDYVSGVQYLDRDGYRCYSEMEVIVGDSSRYINPINARTSTGPPYNMKKFYHYARVDGEAAMSPEMALRADEIKRVLASGDIPIPFARCVLKDEVVKPGKPARVFTMLAAVMNCTIAETIGAVFELMRRNPRFFESMVGIDMSGNGGDLLVEFLSSVDKVLDELEEHDVSKLDKCWLPEMWDAVGLSFGFVAAAIGIPHCPVETLVQALKHTHYEIKGDVFEAPWNPSGQRGTVECNGVAMSISDRYVFYRSRPELVERLLRRCIDARTALRESRAFLLDPTDFPYRTCRALVTYGDDTLKNTAKGVLFSKLDMYEVLENELGLSLTNGKKEKKQEKLPLAEVSFLKRSIVYDQELGRYLCPITKKTIAKMLVAQCDTSLSDKDQAAVGMSNALREAVLHGEDFYNALLVRCRHTASLLGLAANPNFDAPDYSVRRAELRARTFTAWTSPVQLQSGALSFSKMSVQPNIQPPNSEEFVAAPAAAPSTSVGKIETGGELLATPGEQLSGVLQKVPISDLDDFLTRFRLVQNFALPTTVTTSLPEVVGTCRPWTLWLADTQVKAKVQQFALIRGELEVLVKTAIGPGIAGAMEVAAIPDPEGIGNGSTVVMGTINPTNHGAVYPVNCRQTDIHATINYAAADDVLLDLPWVWPYDYLENPYGATGSDQWIINFVSLAPATSAVPSAVSGGNVAVYVRMKPGYTLTVPVMQGGVRKHLSNAVSTLSEAGKGKKRGAISSIADTVSDVTKKLEGIPIIGSYAAMATSAVETAGNIAAFFGFSRNSTQPDSKAFFTRSLPNLVASDDSVPADEQQLIPGIRLDTNPVLACGTEEDPAALSSIFRRWTCYTIFSWSGASASGTRLLHFDVAPGLAMLAGASGTGTTDNVRFFSTAGYVGMPFNWWRGDMEVMVEPFGTPFHRGTLQIAWVPFGSSWSTGDPTSAALNMIFDIEVGQRKVMRIPFARMEPYLRNLIYDMNVGILPSGAANGTFFINVVNPLQGQTATPTIDVAVWIRGCENMDFRVPRDLITNRFLTTPSTNAFNVSVALQGLGDEEKVIEEEFSIGGGSGEFPTDAVLFPGNGFRSVRGLMQRLGKLCWSAVTSNATAHFLSFPYGGVSPISSAVGTYANWIPTVTLPGWYKPLFATFAGSTRVLVIFPSAGPLQAMISAGMYLNEGGLPLDGSQNMPWQVASTNGTATEFHIPYQFAERFAAGQEFADIEVALQQVQVVATGGNASALIPTPQVYAAFGDDLRLGRFAQCPAVVFRATVLVPGFTTFFK